MASAPPGEAWQEGRKTRLLPSVLPIWPLSGWAPGRGCLLGRISVAEHVRATVWPALGLLLAVPFPGRGEEPQVFRGEWLATAEAGRSLKGRWIGQALPGQSNALHGSWTLSAPDGRTVLRGTWWARKDARGWSGTWTAEDQNGRKLSGTWLADREDAQGQNLEDLLKRALSNRVSGSWQTRGRRGHWWLKGSLPAAAP